MKEKHKSFTNRNIPQNAGSVFLLAFGMAFCCFLPFFLKDGGFFIYFGDYNMQQLPFYIKIHEAVRSGTFFWDMKTDLGSSIYTSYSFYLLGSPFFWLTVPFKKEVLPVLLPVLIMFKIALASAGAYCYIRGYVKEKSSACIGGLLYGFCGFQMVSLVFNHFLDVTALFPFYLIAADKLAKEKKRGCFALMTACMAITNYFFFLGEVVFLAFYVLFRHVIGNKENHWKERLYLVCRFCAEGVIGVLMAGFFLLPSILSVAGNSRVSQTIFERNPFFYEEIKLYGALLKSLFLPPDLIRSATLFATKEGAIGSVSLFLPLFAISGVIAFFIQKEKGDFRKRICVASLILALVPMGNALFFAGNATYYARWFYMPLLIMAMMTAVAIEEFDTRAFGWGTMVCGILFGLFLLIGSLSKYVSGSLQEWLLIQNRSDYEMELIITGCSLLVLVYLVWILKKDRKKKYLYAVLASTVLCCVVSMYAHMHLGYNKVSELGRNNYQEQFLAALEFSEEEEGDFYRIEMDETRFNYGMLLDKPSVSAFISTISGSIMDFYHFAGIEREVESKIPYDRPGIRSLLSIRYYLCNEKEMQATWLDSENVPTGYEKMGEKTGFSIYENANALRMGTVFSSFMLRSEYEKLTAEEKDLLLVYALVIEDEAFKTVLSNETLTCLTAEEFQKGYPENKQNFEAQCRVLNRTAADTFFYDDKVLTFSYTGTQGGMVFLSVPYSRGFTAYADGKEMELYMVDGGLMAVLVPAGTRTIELVYQEPGLSAGIVCSIIGVLLFFVTSWIVPFVRKKLNHKN